MTNYNYSKVKIENQTSVGEKSGRMKTVLWSTVFHPSDFIICQSRNHMWK